MEKDISKVKKEKKDLNLIIMLDRKELGILIIISTLKYMQSGHGRFYSQT